MKKFKSLFYLGLTMLLAPVFIFTLVAIASQQSFKTPPAEVHEVFTNVVETPRPKKIIPDTVKEIEPVKPVIKKKKIEIVTDSIKPILDTLNKKDTII